MGRAARKKSSGGISTDLRTSAADLDPVVSGLIPEGVDAELWLEGDRSLIQDPEEVCPGIEAAAEELLGALQEGQRIALFSDYDVDGVTGGEILRGVFSGWGQDPLLGYASPDDGFGLSEDFVRQAWEEGCRTLVTVDCGSQSFAALELARELGMRTIVTDHHATGGENAASHHLNPQLHAPRPSMATGSQMAWHLGAAILKRDQGEVPEEYYREPLYLAGLGCVADWGPHRLPENRPFLKATEAPAGIRALAETKGEDASSLNLLWRTAATLNLAKRTSDVSGEDAARVLRASSAEEASDAIEVLNETGLRMWQEQKAVEEEMKEVDPGSDRLAFFVTEQEGVSGAAGTLALRLATDAGRPAFVFAPMKEGEDGEMLYKFSGRIPNGQAQRIIEMSDDPDVAESIVAGGGHDHVFSGTCRQSDIPRLQAAMLGWADQQNDWSASKKEKREKPLDEREVSGRRLTGIIEGAQQLAPFHRVDAHRPPRVSVRGTISIVDGRRATLRCQDGSEYDIETSCGEGEGEVFLEVRAGQLPLADSLL